MSNTCDLDRILKTECNLQHFTRNCRIKNLDDLERDEAGVHFWRAGILNVKEKGMAICYIMNRCLVMFLRGEIVNVVQYWWNTFVKLKGEQVIILQMDQQLKTKNISDVPGQLFYKDKFLLETDSLYWWSR